MQTTESHERERDATIVRRPLPGLKRVDSYAEAFLAGSGRIFAVFDERTQDSGNISYGLEMDGRRYFVKTAGQPETDASYYDHSKRINELRNAVGVAESSDHRALPKLIQVIESSTGLMLFYEWVEGDLVRSTLDRIHQLPFNEVVDLLTEIYRLHVELAGRGWIAVDFYDSSLDREPFRGTEAQHPVMLRASEMAPADRFQSVAQMCEAWANAGQTGSNTNTETAGEDNETGIHRAGYNGRADRAECDQGRPRSGRP